MAPDGQEPGSLSFFSPGPFLLPIAPVLEGVGDFAISARMQSATSGVRLVAEARGIGKESHLTPQMSEEIINALDNGN